MAKRWQLKQTQVTPHQIDKVFRFFSDARNLEKLTPPEVGFRIVTPGEIEMAPGALIDYTLELYGVTMHWQSRIDTFEPGRLFVDTQVKGPYRYWRHLHEFESASEETIIRDTVDYELPLGPLGVVAHHLFVRKSLDKIFSYRKSVLEKHLAEMP